MAEAADTFVLADVGGTNVRFALLRSGKLGDIESEAVREHKTFAEALAAFLDRHADRSPVRGALFAVAGVVTGECCKLTNNPWIIDGAELRARFGFDMIRLVNDFEALAWSMPHLDRGHLLKLGGSEPVADAPMLVFGPGTGLGMSALVPTPQGGLVLRSEGGHATLPSASPREDAIIAYLRQSLGHVSIERVLSGGGLENLYRAIAAIDQTNVPARAAAEITQAAIDGHCPTCRVALDMFCALLGEVGGNLALVFRAEGGVYIAGGIVRHIRDYLPRTDFRARFEAKGRFQSYLAAIPVHVILRGEPALVGLQALATRGL